MKICVLANQLLTSNLASGGDVLSVEVLKAFHRKLLLISPTISHPSLSAELPSAIIKSSDKSRIVPQSSYLGGLQILLLYLLRALNTSVYFLFAHDFDVLYLTGDFICNSLPAVVCKILNPKVRIFTNFYHLNPPPSKRENRYIFSLTSYLLQRFSLFLIKKSADHLFVLTSEGREILVSLGFDHRLITVSGAGVSPRYQISPSKKHPEYDLLFVGRLNKTKGIYDAVKILEETKKTLPSIRMAVLGSCTDSEAKKINKIVRIKKLEKNYIYLGYLGNSDKIKLMQSIPVLVAPSHEEGFGMGILEALACGMRVAAYDLSVYKLIFGKYKDRIKYAQIGDYRSFSSNLLRLLKKPPTGSPIQVPTWKDVAKIQEDIIVKSPIK